MVTLMGAAPFVVVIVDWLVFVVLFDRWVYYIP